jgi:uncharacterized membrane protein
MSPNAPSALPYSLTVKRNCSISPRAVLGLLAITAFVSFGIGAAFAWLGLWLVLPFVGIEMAALVLAFYLDGRHASDFERFESNGNALVVEIREGNRCRTMNFDSSWVRLVCHDLRWETKLVLTQRSQELVIGRHLNGPGRKMLGQELARVLGCELRIEKSQ